MDNCGYLPFPKGFDTIAIHAGQEPEKWDSLCVVPPIVNSTTFKQLEPAKPKVSRNISLYLSCFYFESYVYINIR